MSREGPVTTSYTVSELESLLLPAVIANGYSELEARAVLSEFLDAELMGVSEYGLRVLPRWLTYDRQRTKTEPTVRTDGAVTRVDVGGRFAHTALAGVLDALEQGARSGGIHLATLQNLTSIVRAGTITRPLAARGLVALCFVFVNGAGARTRALRTPKLGVNLLSVGIPVPSAIPYVYDLALVAMTLRRIEALHKRGGPTPDQPIGFDAEGAETFDASRVSDLLAFGGDRGLGLSLAVQLLAGALIGFPRIHTRQEYRADNGIVVIAIDPARLDPDGAWGERVTTWLRDLEASGTEAFHLPGQRYSRLADPAVRSSPISIEQGILDELLRAPKITSTA